jgi:hypothetical protein
VHLQLHALAYNVANFMRTMAPPDKVEQDACLMRRTDA